MYILFGLNKFLAPLQGTKKFLGGSTKSLAYTDHIIQFGLNKFLAPLSRTENFLGGSTKSLAYTDDIIQFGLNKFLASLVGDINNKFKDQYSN